MTGALISRFLSDVGAVGTVGEGGSSFWLGFFMGVDGYNGLLYFSGFPFRNL